MKRFSILGMMGLISALAVALAALRYAGEVWAGLLLAALLGLLGVSILGVVYRQGKARAGWLGFLVFGSGYALLAFCPGLSLVVGDRLPTSQLMDYAHTGAAGREGLGYSMLNLSYPLTAVEGTENGQPVQDVLLTGSGTIRLGGNIRLWDATGSSPVSALWRSMLPGAVDRDPFLRTGHGLFGLLAGLAGAFIARQFEAGRIRESAEA